MALDRASSVFGALYRRRLTILLTLAGAVGGGFYYGATIPKRYVASAEVLLPNNMPRFSLTSENINIPEGPVLPLSSEDVRTGMMGVMGSGAIHERVAERMPEIPYSYIKKNVSGDIDRLSRFVVIALHEDPQVAADIANEFSTAFEEIVQEQAEHGPRMSLAALHEELPLANVAVDEVQAEMVLSLAEMELVDPDSEMKDLLGERKRIEAMLETKKSSQLIAEAQRPVIEKLLAERPEFQVTARQFSLNSSYTQVIANIGSLAADLAVKRLSFRDDHPEVQGLLERQKVLEEQARVSVERMVHASTAESLDPEALSMLSRLVQMEIAKASYEAEKVVLVARLDEVAKQLLKMPTYQAKLSAIQSRANHLKTHRDRIRMRISELELHLKRGIKFTFRGPNSYATAATSKEMPTLVALYATCAFMGLVLGVILALASELFAGMRLKKPY